MKVFVVIPWRPQPSRIEAFEKLCSFFALNHPDFHLVISDSDGDNFSRSRAKNLGANQAVEMNADVVVFHDADFFTEPQSLINAVELSYKLQEVVLPYNLYCEHREKRETDNFFKNMNFNNDFGCGISPPKILQNGLPSHLYPCSGSVVFPIKIFQELGGYEEKILKWGPEDQLLHRLYFDKYNKLFTYIPGTGHSTYNDPSVRQDSFEEYKDFFDLIFFKHNVRI